MEDTEEYGEIIEEGISLFATDEVIEETSLFSNSNSDESIGDSEVTTSSISLPTNTTKLSDILSFLPYGLVDKKITGIGATYLEMNSPRNSIIVTPTRVLAYNKSIKGEDKYLYIGSPYNGKITSVQDIKAYLNNTSIQNKKFLIVADSLPKLITILQKEKNIDVYKDYFLMIDEIDTLQSDNYFRPVLSNVIDYYIKFNRTNRALVSATINSFSHPVLKEEPVTEIVCNEPTKRNINLIQSNNINQTLANKITEIAENHSSEKILIAYNSVQNILKTIKLLPIEIQDECGILCSEFSKLEARGYEAQINEKDSLSHKIIFMTCAFFSGIDIANQCHLITVSNVSKAHSVLPISRIIQIYGRCRNGVLSDTIIYNYKVKQLSHSSIEEYYNLLVHRANKIITLLNISDELKENDSNITNLFNRIRRLIIEKASGDDDNLFGENTVPLTRETTDKKLEISYFNIDALCEKMNAYTSLYSNDIGLFNQLETEHNVNLEKLYCKISEEQKEAEKYVKNEIKEKNKDSLLEIKSIALSLIRNSELKPKKLIELIHQSKGKESDYLWKLKKHYKYIDNEFLAEELFIICQKNKKSYRGFNNALSFWVLDDNHPFKMQILNSFEVGKKYSSEQIEEILLPIIKYHFFKVNIKKSRLTNFFNNIFRKTYTDGKYLVKGLNPRKIPEPINNIPADADNLHGYFDI